MVVISLPMLHAKLDNSKILGKLKRHAPGENLQSKQDLICHSAKVEVVTHSMADVIPLQCIYYSLRIEIFQKTITKYILHTEENNIRNTVIQHLAERKSCDRHANKKNKKISAFKT